MRIKILVLLAGMLTTFTVFCQDGNRKALSPKETVAGAIDGVDIEIVYCKPSARGRKIIGELVPYGEVWRTGANAATTIEFDKPVTIEGKELAAGKYELFTIPGENEWTVILQNFANQWGAFSYKPQNDILRVNVKPSKTDSFVETFTITIEKRRITLKWENTQVALNVKG